MHTTTAALSQSSHLYIDKQLCRVLWESAEVLCMQILLAAALCNGLGQDACAAPHPVLSTLILGRVDASSSIIQLLLVIVGGN